MQLVSFQVTNFRSVNDSGKIEVRSRTALVGRNESGKTNLLLALEALNPPDGREELLYVKDFPRDRPKSEFSKTLPVVETDWRLNEAERKSLTKIYSRAKDVEIVSVTRRYDTILPIGFEGLRRFVVDRAKISASLKSLRSSVSGSLKGKNEGIIDTSLNALEKLEETFGAATKDAEWASSAQAAINDFRKLMLGQSLDLTEKADERLGELAAFAASVTAENDSAAEARKWVAKKLPVMIYLSDYPELRGHQNLQEIVNKLNADPQTPFSDPEKNFMKLMKVAGLDPDELQKLLAGKHEERQQLVNRAGAVVTNKLRELWTDRPLKVRFNLDAQHFDTLVSNPDAELYDVEVNLDERSRGFKWFFSFYITFTADTAGGEADYAILLLDEPGLFLHAVAQRDLLDHFAQDFSNQILYTTHSPFMIPVDDLGSIRTVNIGAKEGTTVTNDPTGDEKTLFPLQTALGYDLTQTLFVGDKTLVVEGITDYWYLSSVSEYLNDVGETGLPDIVITPAGGAQKVSYMVSLLASQNLKVMVLFDDEPKAQETAEELIKGKLIRQDYVVFVSEGLETEGLKYVDVEDIIDPQVFDALVRESYQKELKGVTLNVNEKLPRIVTRYEKAFEDAGLAFNKTRPARLFVRKIADNPDAILTELTRKNFERLFRVVEERLEKLLRRDRPPFD